MLVSLAAKPNLSDYTSVIERIVLVPLQVRPVRLLPSFRSLADKRQVFR
jgi:hypothetical protein